MLEPLISLRVVFEVVYAALMYSHSKLNLQDLPCNLLINRMVQLLVQVQYLRPSTQDSRTGADESSLLLVDHLVEKKHSCQEYLPKKSRNLCYKGPEPTM